MALGIEVGLGSGHIVLDGYPAPPHLKRGTAAHFSAHVYCSQTAGWIKGITWYESRPRHRPHCVTRGSGSPKGTQPPIFGACLLSPSGRPSQLLLNTCGIVCRRDEFPFRRFSNTIRVSGV